METILTEAASNGGVSPGIGTMFQAADAIESRPGLKLAPAKGPVATIVIDRAERPAEN